mgnify:CR=1 FL=1
MDHVVEDFGFRKLPHQLMREIAHRHRKKRTQKKLSQAELADRSGVSLGSLKRFESTGKISIESLLKLAYALDSTAEFETLFQGEDLPQTLDELFRK